MQVGLVWAKSLLRDPVSQKSFFSTQRYPLEELTLDFWFGWQQALQCFEQLPSSEHAEVLLAHRAALHFLGYRNNLPHGSEGKRPVLKLSSCFEVLKQARALRGKQMPYALSFIWRRRAIMHRLNWGIVALHYRG